MTRIISINKQIEEHKISSNSVTEQAELISTIAETIIKAFRNGNKIIFMGNGGSAADAQHFAAELVGKYQRDREPLPALALSVNTSILTAISNDLGYEQVFSRQIRGLTKPGDIVVGISTSGNSKNVILAMEEAKKCGAITVSLTGTGGKLKDITDFTISVNSRNTPRIQEVHIVIGHIICSLVEEEIFGNKNEL